MLAGNQYSNLNVTEHLTAIIILLICRKGVSCKYKFLYSQEISPC
jgi:hypothetical protein